MTHLSQQQPTHPQSVHQQSAPGHPLPHHVASVPPARTPRAPARDASPLAGRPPGHGPARVLPTARVLRTAAYRAVHRVDLRAAAHRARTAVLEAARLLVAAQSTRRWTGRRTMPRRDAGMATAEYAVVTVAAVGFAGLLVVLLRSSEVHDLLAGIIRKALSAG